MSGFVEKLASPVAGQRRYFTRAARSAVWVVLVSSLTYYAIFRLPFRFPPRQRLWSASYAFGYNNGVAILAMGILLGGIALFLFWRHREVTELKIDFAGEPVVAERKAMGWAFALVSILYALLTFAMYLYYMQTASWLMWEVRHFLHRTRLMELYGLRPYVDFQAEYGPLLIVTAVYVHKLLRSLGSSLEQSYFISHFLLNLAGLWCIHYVLSRARMPQATRITAFILLAIAGFAPYMGLNGVLPRYLCPIACLLLGHRILSREQSQPATARWCLRAVLTILLLLAINVMLSPEAAMAFAIAWLTYAVLMLRSNRALLATSIVAMIAAAIVCWLTLPDAYYGSLLHFSEGANNFPLIPALHIVFYVLTLFLIVPPLLAAGLGRSGQSHLAAAAFCTALGVLCVVMAPGALGRCDPPHVLFYGMVASMLLMIRFGNTSRGAFAAYAVAYAGVFIIFMQLVNLHAFFQVPLRSLLSPHGLKTVVRHLRSTRGTDQPSTLALSALNRYPKLALPLATFGDPKVENYVVCRGQLAPEYYVAIVGVYTSAALEHKLHDVARAECLLVPKTLATSAEHNPCQAYLQD